MAEQKKSGKKEKEYSWPPEDTRQHLKAARKAIRESYKSFFPPEFIEHRRAARREMLLAARSLINHAIERMETRKEA